MMGGGKQPFFGAPSPDAAVFVISVAAELTGLHPQTLRAYERMGLIQPGRTGCSAARATTSPSTYRSLSTRPRSARRSRSPRWVAPR